MRDSKSQQRELIFSSLCSALKAMENQQNISPGTSASETRAFAAFKTHRFHLRKQCSVHFDRILIVSGWREGNFHLNKFSSRRCPLNTKEKVSERRTEPKKKNKSDKIHSSECHMYLNWFPLRSAASHPPRPPIITVNDILFFFHLHFSFVFASARSARAAPAR